MWQWTWTSPELEVAGDAAATWAADRLAEAGVSGDGLYVATPDAGAREALAFWAAAGQTGFAFASPAAFPWTLANSPTGRISQRLGVTGPCVTLVGDQEAVDEALLMAYDDLSAGRVGTAVVVRLASTDPVRADGAPTRLVLEATVVGAAVGSSAPRA